MEIEVAQHARMSERGSSLLRLIQNDHMPILDLLVRESIQNSMDAVKVDEEYVEVEFEIGKFKKESLVSELEGIKDSLNKRFNNLEYKFLKIKDSKTYGLTGPIKIDDVIDDNYGNLLKLVYEISLPQSKEGAGGSWGLGKTVYFRLGIGLVIYYSRIKMDNGNYESRLAACMVEDETKADAIIPSPKGKPKRGIAWWGEGVAENSTIPVTDEYKIREILNIFGITSYEAQETGTTIIIPFINEETLIPHEKNVESNGWWSGSIENYIKMAIQRWYAPRLDNVNYQYGSWLKARVNNEEIKYNNMEPVFQVIQSLYTRVFFENKELAKDFISDYPYFVNEINVRNDLVGRLIGNVAYIKLDRTKLLMNAPYNYLSPFNYVNLHEVDSTNPPLICYVRKPGMVVSYETTGKWTNGIEKTNSDEFIIGIFVPNSKIYLRKVQEKITLEEYLRKSEKADHTSWSDFELDGQRKTLISRIQAGVAKAIKEKYTRKEQNGEVSRNYLLSKTLAKQLLPPHNFGKSSNYAGGTGGTGTQSKNKHVKNSKFTISSEAEYKQDIMSFDFELKLGKKATENIVQIQVLTERTGMKGDIWESETELGTKFPIEMTTLCINSINDESINLVLTNNNNFIQHENLKIELLKTNRFSVKYGFKVIKDENDTVYRIKGNIGMKHYDDYIQGTLTFEEVKSNE